MPCGRAITCKEGTYGEHAHRRRLLIEIARRPRQVEPFARDGHHGLKVVRVHGRPGLGLQRPFLQPDRYVIASTSVEKPRFLDPTASLGPEVRRIHDEGERKLCVVLETP